MKTQKGKKIAIGAAWAAGTALLVSSFAIEAAERRLTASTSCFAGGSSDYDDTRYRGRYGGGTDLIVIGKGGGDSTKFVCSIPSDSYMPHYKLSKINVHGVNLGNSTAMLELKVCVTDFATDSYACGRALRMNTISEYGKKFTASLVDVGTLRHSDRRGWFPVLVGSGMNSSKSLTGYWLKGGTGQ